MAARGCGRGRGAAQPREFGPDQVFGAVAPEGPAIHGHPTSYYNWTTNANVPNLQYFDPALNAMQRKLTVFMKISKTAAIY